MPISTTCPKCQALFRLPEELAGRTVKCQKCAALFVAPSAGADTTMPGAPVMLEAEPVPEMAQAGAGAPSFALPPMPTDAPSPPSRWDDEPADPERYSESPRKPAAIATKPAEGPRRARRGEQSKSGGSKIGVVIGIAGFLLIAFIVCAGATGIWYAVAEKKRAVPIAKEAIRKKDAVNFNEFQNGGINGIIQNRPAFDGFKDGKIPEPPPPGPPDSIPVVFGPDGAFENFNKLTQDDPLDPFGKRHKLYTVRLEVGYIYQFDMMANPLQLDAFLILRDDKGRWVAENDDIQQGVQRNARLIYAPVETGIYHLEATYWDPQGAPNAAPGQLFQPVGDFTLTARHVK